MVFNTHSYADAGYVQIYLRYHRSIFPCYIITWSFKQRCCSQIILTIVVEGITLATSDLILYCHGTYGETITETEGQLSLIEYVPYTDYQVGEDLY